jgi:hypothetical protein
LTVFRFAPVLETRNVDPSVLPGKFQDLRGHGRRFISRYFPAE